jgi:hypothetical protein
MVVRRIPVDVVQHQRQVRAEPRVRSAADRATTALGVGEKLPDVVGSAAVDRGLTRVEPTPSAGVAANRGLTSVAAVDLLSAFHESRTAMTTLSHLPDATTAYRQEAAAEWEPPIGIEPMAVRLQGGSSTTELRGLVRA